MLERMSVDRGGDHIITAVALITLFNHPHTPLRGMDMSINVVSQLLNSRTTNPQPTATQF